jgi:hypothetical protein
LYIDGGSGVTSFKGENAGNRFRTWIQFDVEKIEKVYRPLMEVLQQMNEKK